VAVEKLPGAWSRLASVPVRLEQAEEAARQRESARTSPTPARESPPEAARAQALAQVRPQMLAAVKAAMLALQVVPAASAGSIRRSLAL
jgi:hypothetical protein